MGINSKQFGRTHLIIPDQHAHPDYNNDRADWIGKLMLDVKPDVVINMGDAADMASLSHFDKGLASFHGNTYSRDIESHLEFQERMWRKPKAAKKRLPWRVILEGNHEHRIKRVLDQEPQLGGSFGLSFRDLDWESYYNEIIPYKGGYPDYIEIDGVSYAHFFISGVMGRPIGGDHHAATLIAKNYTSCTAAHSHTVDWAVRTKTNGEKIMGAVVGVYQDYKSPWAGLVNDLWWSGVVVKREVQNGVYNPQFIGIDQLRREYS